MSLSPRWQWFSQANGHSGINVASYPRICIAATGGSCGKTLLSLGLGRAWKNSRIIPLPFKKGPDYIDSAWLSAACGAPTSCLDLYFQPPDALRQAFLHAMNKAGTKAIAIIEGNRGLFDGLDESGSCSTASLARVLACPVLLCIDCAKTTRTIAAVLSGLINFEKDIHFAGIILNRVGSTRHEAALRSAIATYLDLPVLGALPRLSSNPLPERHMGISCLANPSERDATLDYLGEFVTAHCDTDAIASCARKSPDFPMDETLHVESGLRSTEKLEIKREFKKIDANNVEHPLIGYVHDDAFWFYYPENLEALTNAGARTIRLSLLEANSPDIFKTLSGLYLGGGFPEDYAPQISISPLTKALKNMVNKGLPVYAECGGLMLLCHDLLKDDKIWPMAGVFDANVQCFPKPQGLGYVEAQVIGENPFFTQGQLIRGHEFHYSRCLWSGPKPDFQMALKRGVGMVAGYDGIIKNNAWASYLHIYAPAIPSWASRFVTLAASWRPTAS